MDRKIGAATKLRYLANSVQPSLLRNGKVGTKRHSIFIKTVRHTLAVKMFGVTSRPQEKCACDFHDDATPLSFQLQVAEDFFKIS